LVYLYFTAPRKDSTAFASYQSRMTAWTENRSSRPETVFQDTVVMTMAQYHYRARPWSAEVLKEMDLDKSLEFFQGRFADAGDFTFVVVGNFDLETLRPLVTTYLGGLPTSGRQETWRDLDIDPPTGVIEKKVFKGIEQKGRVQITFTGDFEWDRQNRYDFQSMVSTFRIKLREILREDSGGTYGVRVIGRPQKDPESRYRLGISFGCDPARIEELTQTIFVQIDSLKQTGLGEEYVTKIRERHHREREVNLKENDFWIHQLVRAYNYQEDPLLVLQYSELVDNLSVETIRSAARRYFNETNYVQVVLYPEE